MTVLLVLSVTWGPFLFFEYLYAGGLWGVGFLVGVYLLAFAVRAAMPADQPALTLSIAATPATSVHDELVGQTVLLAVLVERAMLEQSLGLSVAHRERASAVFARQLDVLRVRGAWDGIDSQLKLLLTRPCGEWSAAERDRALGCYAWVLTLRWMLDLTFDLPPLRTVERIDRSALTETIAECGRLYAGGRVRLPNAMHAERNPCGAYARRIQSEFGRRGIKPFEVDDRVDFMMAEYTRYAVRSGEMEIEAEDLPIGNQLVAEVSDEVLFSVWWSTMRRGQMLQALADVASRRSSARVVSLIAHTVCPIANSLAGDKMGLAEEMNAMRLSCSVVSPTSEERTAR